MISLDEYIKRSEEHRRRLELPPAAGDPRMFGNRKIEMTNDEFLARIIREELSNLRLDLSGME